jgi:NAD(P)H-nitrite reductase large subunit
MSVIITMCVCQRMPFERLLPIALERDWDLADIMRETQCGAGCGLCRPYLRRMLETGQTVFTEILTEPLTP